MQFEDPIKSNPKARKQLRYSQFALVLVALVLLGSILAIALTSIADDQGKNTLPPWAWLTILAVEAVFLYGMYKLVQHQIHVPLRRAAELMATVAPKDMLLRTLGVAEINGMIAALYEPGIPLYDIQDVRPTALISLRAGRKHLPKAAKGIPVRIYAKRDSGDRFLAVETEKQLLWGYMSTKESRAKARRNIRLTMRLMVVLLLAMLGVFLALQQELIQDVKEERDLAAQSAHWPTVQGIVAESRIKDVKVSRGKSTVPGFEAVIRYRYQAGGRSYEADLIHFCYKATSNREHAEQLTSTFPEGAAAMVAYSPDKPALAVLYPGYTDHCNAELDRLATLSIIILVISVIAAAVIMTVFVLQARQQKKFMHKVEQWGLP